jgi:hypothetical protein
MATQQALGYFIVFVFPLFIGVGILMTVIFSVNLFVRFMSDFFNRDLGSE